MAMPTNNDINTANRAWVNAKKAVRDDEEEIVQDREKIRNLNIEINNLRNGLLAKEQAVHDAKKALDALLNEIVRETGLDIKATESSVVQGAKAAFKAEYDLQHPPTGVKLLWDTGGCPIVEGNENSEEIKVDTSSVEPGDYGISISLIPN
jgi:predicted  nucleic acid-binding Zn-ribbon protein